jgi:hypothetical protein
MSGEAAYSAMTSRIEHWPNANDTSNPADTPSGIHRLTGFARA